MVKFGFIVALETQNSYTESDLKKVAEHVNNHDNLVGDFKKKSASTFMTVVKFSQTYTKHYCSR